MKYAKQISCVFYTLEELALLLSPWSSEYQIICLGPVGCPFRSRRIKDLKKLDSRIAWFALAKAASCETSLSTGVLPASRIMISNPEVQPGGITEAVIAVNFDQEWQSHENIEINRVYETIRKGLRRISTKAEIINTKNGKTYRCTVSDGAVNRLRSGERPIEYTGPSGGDSPNSFAIKYEDHMYYFG